MLVYFDDFYISKWSCHRAKNFLRFIMELMSEKNVLDLIPLFGSENIMW